jgi:hypothetical protein
MPKQGHTVRVTPAASKKTAGRKRRSGYWSSAPTVVMIPDLTDPEQQRTISVDPSILANSAAARGWIGIPTPQSARKKQQLTAEKRAAKLVTEAMQRIAEQAYSQIKQTGLTGDEAAILAAIDAATRGFLVGLVAMQGGLVGPPSQAGAEVELGRRSKATARAAGKKSRRPSKITDEQAAAVWIAQQAWLDNMPPEEAVTLSAPDKQMWLVEEIEAKYGISYTPRSAQARVNRAISRL